MSTVYRGVMKKAICFDLFRSMTREELIATPNRALAAMLRDRHGESAPHLSTVCDYKSLFLADVLHEESEAAARAAQFSFAGAVLANLTRWAPSDRVAILAVAKLLDDKLNLKSVSLPPKRGSRKSFSIAADVWRCRAEHAAIARVYAELIDGALINATGKIDDAEASNARFDLLFRLTTDEEADAS